MGTFFIWNLIIFAITLHLAAPLFFYVMYNGVERLKLDVLRDVDLSNVDKIVIDLLHPYYLTYIEDNKKWATLSSDPTAQLKYHWNEVGITITCSFNKHYGFFCDEVTRLVIIKGKNMQFDLQVYGHETYFEKYIGCYEYNKVHRAGRVITELYECLDFCKKYFMFGVTEGKECICINSTLEFTPVDLRLCNKTCEGKPFQFCGGSGHFSIFRTPQRSQEDKDEPFQPPWECIYNEFNCSTCPEGRYGLSCENRNCTINNGDCGEIDCQTYIFKCGDCRCKTCNFSISMCVCRPGFYLYGEFTDCRDIDECEANIYSCSENMSCVNIEGSYICECPLGYYLADGILCTDIDECIGIPCGLHQDCQNTHGSYTCNCIHGFYRINATSCADIDECKTMETCDKISTICKNLDGDYECICKFGFDRLDSDSPKSGCSDVDECTLSESCDESTTSCENLLGDYECLCKKGYTRMEFKSRKSQCQDEDECFQEDKCPSGVVCLNLIGSYDCVCPNGTKKQTYTHTIECEDIDECEIPDLCDQTTSFCLNTIRSYICACRAGYVPINNYTCVLSDQMAKENTSRRWEDNYSTEVYDEEYDDIFEEYYPYAFGFFVVLILGTIFISLLCRSKKAPPSRMSSLSSVSSH